MEHWVYLLPKKSFLVLCLPNIKQAVIQASTIHFVQGIRKKRLGGGWGGSLQIRNYQITKAHAWIRSVEAPFIHSLHNSWANQVCNVLSSLSAVFTMCSYWPHRLCLWMVRKPNFCGQSTTFLNFQLWSRTQFQNCTKQNFIWLPSAHWGVGPPKGSSERPKEQGWKSLKFNPEPDMNSGIGTAYFPLSYHLLLHCTP